MSDREQPDPAAPFFLVVADHDRRFFSVEGPMTDDGPWISAVRRARDYEQWRVTCGPRGTGRAALAAEYRRLVKMDDAPPGGIVRPRG
jgi:hypothetical protein